MKKVWLLTALVLLGWLATPKTAQAQYNNWAVGFRVGEPAGVNVRKYFGENRAFDLNIGTYGGLYGNARKYRSGRYRSVGLAVQGHYLWHKALTKSESVRGYYGFGGQINTRRYYPIRLNGEYENALSLGGSGIAGVEYFPAGKPYSFFLETGLYVELLQAPFFLNLNSGLGLRYNF
ncbi:hypothetical protein HNV11_14845 [Spirosoma taeanense]|uniref:Outer membrane protein beta-barrel domain-containing protein n=1 Tax=Spirosoma taeanense TaxID=2735870 RepID=A0A6M5YB32_9BACT|nr:hypothetical protein [Spirosoma taeanense]QJW90566.1 hypothetical protein HNV11_14845 [Spirosoma taeanense]